jgi:hypothetical protein
MQATTDSEASRPPIPIEPATLLVVVEVLSPPIGRFPLDYVT